MLSHHNNPWTLINFTAYFGDSWPTCTACMLLLRRYWSYAVHVECQFHYQLVVCFTVWLNTLASPLCSPYPPSFSGNHFTVLLVSLETMGLMRFQMALNFWSFSAHLHGAEIKRMCHRAQFCQWLPPLSCGLILKFELPVARFPYFPSSTLIFTDHFMFSQLSEWFQQLPWNRKLISGPSKF